MSAHILDKLWTWKFQLLILVLTAFHLVLTVSLCYLESVSNPLRGWATLYLEVFPRVLGPPGHVGRCLREGSHFLNGLDWKVTVPSVRWPVVTFSQVLTSSLLVWGSSAMRGMPPAPGHPNPVLFSQASQLSKYLSSMPGRSKSTITTLCLFFTLEKTTIEYLNVADKKRQ